jgi:single-stranded-DNA-specific exonuclease
MFIEKKYNREIHDKLVSNGMMSFLAKVIAARVSDDSTLDNVLNPTDEYYKRLYELKDMDVAVPLLLSHLGESLILSITDSDADGVSCAAIVDRSIVDYFNHPKDKLITIVNKRVYGNGVNDEMVRRTLEIHKETPIGLVITADHGSSDDVRIKKLREAGIDVIVTDHHSIPTTGKLQHANAFINPIRDDDNFTEINISGAQVVYFLMYCVYEKLDERSLISKRDNMRSILPIVSNTILSDSMSLLSPINRHMLSEGMKELNISEEPQWTLLRNRMSLNLFDENVISFTITPHINAANRLGSPELAYEFLSARDINKADLALSKLVELNNERKRLESEMIAFVGTVARLYPFKNTKVLIIPRGPGVSGLVSQTIGERYNQPTITFTLTNKDTLVGSGRTILTHLNLKEIFDEIKENYPGIMIKGGGHSGAAGCEIHNEKLYEFMEAFDTIVARQNKGVEIRSGSDTTYDFEIPIEYISEKLVDDINNLGPFGREFERPVLKTEGLVTKVFKIGRPPLHCALDLMTKDRRTLIKCFYPRSGHLKLKDNVLSTIVGSINMKYYKGKKSLDLSITAIEQ